jgi:hypothetical protein
MSNKWKIAKTITPKLKSKLEPGKNKFETFFPKNNEDVIKFSYFLGICAKFHTKNKRFCPYDRNEELDRKGK